MLVHIVYIISIYMISKGMFQNPLIMYTLAHAHLVEYGNNIPSQLNDDNKPIGAIILSLQAVSTKSTAYLSNPLTCILSG